MEVYRMNNGLSAFDSTYIYLVICPLSGHVLHVDCGGRPKISLHIRKSDFYSEWRQSIKLAKAKPIYAIIDRVSIQEVSFWVEHYEDLFITWGFDLWIIKIREQMRIAFMRRSNNIVYKLVDNLDSTEISNDVYNYGHLIQLAGDLMKIKFVSRDLDELTVIIILSFFYGMSLRHFISINMGELRYLIDQNMIDRNGFIRYGKLEQFVLNYVRHYSPRKRLSKAFLKETNSEMLNRRMKNVSKYFGYTTELKYEDREILCKLMQFTIGLAKGKDMELLEEEIKSTQKYEQYMLMTNNSKQFYINNILTFEEVLDVDIK